MFTFGISMALTMYGFLLTFFDEQAAARTLIMQGRWISGYYNTADMITEWFATLDPLSALHKNSVFSLEMFRKRYEIFSKLTTKPVLLRIEKSGDINDGPEGFELAQGFEQVVEESINPNNYYDSRSSDDS